MWALAHYTGPVRAAILAGKEKGRRDLPPRLGVALGAAVVHLLAWGAVAEPVWLVPAPSRPAAARRRGGDPVRAMATAAARTVAGEGLAAGVAPCLVTAVLLVDDVLTTGSTAVAAAATLAAAGRRPVGMLTLAAVPRWVNAR